MTVLRVLNLVLTLLLFFIIYSYNTLAIYQHSSYESTQSNVDHDIIWMSNNSFMQQEQQHHQRHQNHKITTHLHKSQNRVPLNRSPDEIVKYTNEHEDYAIEKERRFLSYQDENQMNEQQNENQKKNLTRRRQQRGQRLKKNRNVLRLLAGLTKHNIQDSGGAWPPIIDVAAKALVSANSTCGQQVKEEYCKLYDAHPQRSRASHCGICDSNSPDADKRHPIANIIDGSNKWWQSSSLHYGKDFEYVTITIDLRQIYQILFIKIKAAISPRPASWILERSIDGEQYNPWQYFGVSDDDCMNRYNLPASNGLTRKSDTEVICSTMFSKPIPMENGEIHVSLLSNRPGARNQSADLLDFSLARFIRFRLQGLHSHSNLVQWSLDSTELDIRSFYSFRNIKIGGRLFCWGHAEQLHHSDPQECDCIHNTCGTNCEKCCPFYNQRSFKAGTSMNENPCERCECHGHATECYYNPEVDLNGLSLNTNGKMSGGGVCLNCTGFTTGINCEQCIPYYYRPYGVSPNASKTCVPCSCDPAGTVDGGLCKPIGGECICRPGFTGPNCAQCHVGYKGENCTKCDCDIRGTMPGGECESHCQCKLNVEGKYCDKCISGYFGLNIDNAEGCVKCFCSGVGLSCNNIELKANSFESMDNWQVTDISNSIFVTPSSDNDTGNLYIGMYEFPDKESIYWLAPKEYAGNILDSYGSHFLYQVGWIIVRGDTSGKPTTGPSIILIGKNGMKIAYGDEIFKSSNATINIRFTEDGWYHVPRAVKDIVTRLRRTEYRGDPVTRVQFMSVLSNTDSVMLRGTFHTDQVESVLMQATMNLGANDVFEDSISLVETCKCPSGYSGLSCESCDFGHVRVYENSSAHELLGKCVPCACNGHAKSCELETNECSACLHNTFGERCERCAVGFYGNAMIGTEYDCSRCACPLLESSNNFSPSCQLKVLSLAHNEFSDNKLYNNITNFNYDQYICTQCPQGYTGDHCDVCDDGFYGEPVQLGSLCLECPCDGGPCDALTGKCIICLGNTEGWRCERCKAGYWGDPIKGCEPCRCNLKGSVSNICDTASGHCECNHRYAGHHCDECEFGYGNVALDCPSCNCNANGSTENICNTRSGQCPCKMGLNGLKCDTCLDEYYGFSIDGCEVSILIWYTMVVYYHSVHLVSGIIIIDKIIKTTKYYLWIKIDEIWQWECLPKIIK